MTLEQLKLLCLQIETEGHKVNYPIRLLVSAEDHNYRPVTVEKVTVVYDPVTKQYSEYYDDGHMQPHEKKVQALVVK